MKKLSTLLTLVFTITLIPIVIADFGDSLDLNISFNEYESTSTYHDIDNFYKYKTAVDTISKKGIVKGYSDGSYRPLSKINRAEFTKIIVEAKLGKNPTQSAGNCFPDVAKTDWFASSVCYAKSNNIIDGYADGHFKPTNNIKLSEAAKILVNTMKIQQVQPVDNKWYSVYVETLANKKYIPQTFGYVGQNVNRGEMAEMIWRINNKKSDQQSVTVSILETACQSLGSNLPSNIDMKKVQSAWLGWYNDVRKQEGLVPYEYNDQLARTGYVWSEKFKVGKAKEMTHKRSPNGKTYDHNAIRSWLKDLGLEFKSINGSTFTENTGWAPYFCSKAGDCTDDFINSIKWVFDFYMAEKGQSYDAHYRAIINRNFKEIGLGVAWNQSAGQFYLTVHYGTDITSNPLPICK